MLEGSLDWWFLSLYCRPTAQSKLEHLSIRVRCNFRRPAKQRVSLTGNSIKLMNSSNYPPFCFVFEINNRSVGTSIFPGNWKFHTRRIVDSIRNFMFLYFRYCCSCESSRKHFPRSIIDITILRHSVELPQKCHSNVIPRTSLENDNSKEGDFRASTTREKG